MLKSLPSIDQVLSYPDLTELAGLYSRELALEWARAAVEELRKELQEGAELAMGIDGKIAAAVVVARVIREAEVLLTPSLRRVINATGVVIHTNLGRAPLSFDIILAMHDAAGGYSNLEFDLETGTRGSRHVHLARLIRAVTGAEAGFVVNNNAAAVLVALNTLALGREVVVSRGELVEIGGSFRIPEIIARSGAVLKEVGATNKTKISDYEKAIGPDTAALLKVHPSNFKIVGFTEEVSLPELCALGAREGIPVMMDLGSGLLVDLEAHGLKGEQPVRAYVEQNADLVTFSGDKLLGGPQAGFIVGKRELVASIQANPMVRALRVDKITIAALTAVLRAYLSPATLAEKVPVLTLLFRKPAEIKAEAGKLARGLAKRWPAAALAVLPDEALAGGGALPAEPIPTYVVSLEAPGWTADQLAAAFRGAATPIVGRMKAGKFCLDCRTLLPGDLAEILAAAEKISSEK